jgi:hypothetical protein
VRLATKVNLAVGGLLAASALAVGAFFFVSFRELRDETFRWFDANGRRRRPSAPRRATLATSTTRASRPR